jgi:acyl-coenzyme A thioesterase PaaI-like protein
LSEDTTQPQPARRRFFEAEGAGFRPTGIATSPWRRDAQNGLAMGLLITHSLEQRPEAAQSRLARLTIDILRPAPFDFTEIAWRVVRGGRRVQVLEGEFVAGGVVSCRASALLVAPTGPPPPPQAGEPPAIAPEEATGGLVLPPQTGLDARRVQDAADNVHSMWLRVEADVVPGARASPVATALALSDFGGATARRYSRAWTYPNLDIDVHFSRTPRGEWLHASSTTMMMGRGVGVVEHRLSDREGPVARAHQTLYFSRAPEGRA